MRAERRRDLWTAAAFAVLLLAASFAVFGRLGDSLLWQDEAQTALISETVLAHGVPLGYDGRNSFSMEDGADYGKGYLWRYHPWLQFYLTAASFAVLGKTTLAARLPFALFGVGTIALVFFLAQELSGSAIAGCAAMLLLTGSVPFLLLSRQCRYYAPAAFFTTLALYAYVRLTSAKRRSVALLVAASVLLFYCHYLYYGVLFGAIVLHAAWFHRTALKDVARAAATSLLFVLPGALWHLTMPYGKIYVLGYRDPGVALGLLVYFVRDIGRYLVPPVFVVFLLIAGFLLYRTKRARNERRAKTESPGWALLAIWIACCLIAVSLLSTEYYFRYLGPAMPVFCVLAALFVDRLRRAHAALGALAVALFLYPQPWRDYLHELTHHYVGPMDGFVSYLNANAKPNDVVWATLEDLPIKFYTGLRVVSSMTGEDLSKAPRPDWLVFRRFAFNASDVAARAFIKEHLRKSDFEEIRLPYPDIAFHNREDPEHHKYGTVLDAPAIVIYRRKT